MAATTQLESTIPTSPTAEPANLNMVDMYTRERDKQTTGGDSGVSAPARVNDLMMGDISAAQSKVPPAAVAEDGSIQFDAPTESRAVEDPHSRPTDNNAPLAPGKDAPPAPGNKLVTDDKGRVTEVDYANGTSRKFGYGDDNKINMITRPDGIVLEFKDGHWQAALSETGSANSPIIIPVDLVDPQVAPDGTFTYHTEKGTNVRFAPDGSGVLRNDKENWTVARNPDEHVESIVGPDGKKQTFHYNDKGELDEYTNQKGEVLHLKDGQWQTADGKPAPMQNIEVTANGVIVFEDPATQLKTSITPDGQRIVNNSNGSIIKRDAGGRPIESVSADGNVQHKYEYDDQNKLTTITDNHGGKFTDNGDGTWSDKDGNKLTNFKLAEDGRIQFTDKDGHIVVHSTSGETTTTTKTEAELQKQAEDIHNTGNADEINAQVNGMTDADRIALQQAYEKKYNSKLTDDLTHRFEPYKINIATENLNVSNLKDHAANSLLPKASQQFINDLNSFITRAKQLGLPDETVTATMGEIDKMLTVTDGKINATERKVVAAQMMAFAANPSSIDQGKHGTCNVTDIEIISWTRNPQVAAQIVTDMALKGEWTAPDGHKVTLPPQDFVPQEEGSVDSTSSNNRLFASQIFQATALTDWGTRQNPPQYYLQTKPSQENPSGEYWSDKDGNIIMEKDDTGKMEPSRFMGWEPEPIIEELTRLGGDPNQVFINADFPKEGQPPNALFFKNETDFADAIVRAKDEGQMPVIIVVAALDPVFGGNAQPGTKEHRRNHVVVIDDYNPVTGQVKIDNTWGDKNDKWVDVADMYRATGA